MLNSNLAVYYNQTKMEKPEYPLTPLLVSSNVSIRHFTNFEPCASTIITATDIYKACLILSESPDGDYTKALKFLKKCGLNSDQAFDAVRDTKILGWSFTFYNKPYWLVTLLNSVGEDEVKVVRALNREQAIKESSFTEYHEDIVIGAVKLTKTQTKELFNF